MSKDELIEKIRRGEIVTPQDVADLQAAEQLRQIQSEAAALNNVADLEKKRAEMRGKNIARLLELDRQAEAAAAGYEDVFIEREQMLKESARREQAARAKWYQIFLEFSKISKQINSDDASVDKIIRQIGGRVNAARENIQKFEASDALRGLILSGEFQQPTPARSDEELREMMGLFESLQRKQSADQTDSFGNGHAPRETASRDSFGNDLPPKKAA